MYKKNIFFLFFLAGIISTNSISAQESDSLKNYWLNQVEIRAKRINLGDNNNKISKDNLDNILSKNGFALIRKGVFFAQDIFADGLKKGDINVVIDGERYHSACPNRMDSPLTRVNPLELESVDLNKSSGNIQSGLGGVVQFNRSNPTERTNIQVGLSALSGAQNGIDFASTGDYLNHRVSLRYAQGTPFSDGENRTFKDSYNYKDNYNFRLAEGSLRGAYDILSYGLSFSYTDDVSFPYLLMDERFNRVYSAYLSYDKNKLYFNYTDHIMDNELRVSSMLMRTSAKNLTIGAIGEFYEVVYRNWDADNYFKTPTMVLTNDLMPNVSTYSVNLFKQFEISNLQVHTKLGFSYHNVGEKSRETFYSNYFADAKLKRFFPTFSLGVSHMTALSKDVGVGGMLEINSESPETESLFIAVKKPGTKPAWSGNPNLEQPIKATIRGSLTYNNILLELFGSQIWNYNNLAKQVSNQTPFLTYSNIDAYMLGTSVNYSSKYLEVDGSYIWAKNTLNDFPLSEIPPLRISTKVISPEFSYVRAYLKHTYNNSQKRVDLLLLEKTSNSWNRIDLGLMFSFEDYNIALDIENLLNANYFQHLSYLRDPFASGLQVYEPGRVFRITFKTNHLF